MTSERKEITTEKPKISRYAIALFDVLGFSRMVEDKPLQEILDTYHFLIEKAVLRPNEKGSLSAVQTSEGALLTVIPPPNFAYFSDTILLWCPLVPELVGDFVERCSSLVCEALAIDIPLRGAITLGDAVMDKELNYYIGQPIVEAAKLEQGQEWVGLALGNTAIWSPFLTQLHGTVIIEYTPPMKEKYKEYASPIVVDWPRRWRDENGDCPSKKLEQLNKKPKFSTKWTNTIEFARFSSDKHDWHLRPDEIKPDAFLKLMTRDEAFKNENNNIKP